MAVRNIIIKECARRVLYTFDDDAFDEYVVGPCWKEFN